MVLKNEDIKELVMEVLEGHKHLRTTILLEDGSEVTFQEATIANLVRAYITVKTHSTRTSVRLKGERLYKTKKGYAEWQLLEVT